MRVYAISDRQRAQLRSVVRSAPIGDAVRRAQALLWLDERRPIRQIAAELGVARQTIYNWYQAFQQRSTQPLRDRLQDQPRSGRPRTQRAAILGWLPTVLAKTPADYGFRERHWTAGRLRCVVERLSQQAIGIATVRRALHDMRLRYKRPRYTLARRDPQWRQAKGGSKQA